MTATRDRSLAHALAEAGETPTWQWDKLDKQREFLTSTEPFTMFSGGFASGKCERYDTWVETKQGRVQLQDIQIGDLVWTVDEQCHLVLKPVLNRIDSGLLPETIVRLDNGLSVSCSPWHPFLRLDSPRRVIDTTKPTRTISGKRLDRRRRVVEIWQWVRADAISPGDRIAVARDYPSNLSCGISGDNLFLLGTLIGDGGLSQKAIVLTIGQDALAEELTGILYGSGVELRKRSAKYRYDVCRAPGSKKNWLLDWLYQLGLMGCTSHTKFVPPFLFGASHTDIAAFLSGLIVTDGWVDKAGLGYCSVSEKLLDGVQALFLRLGIRASKSKKIVKYKEGRVAYTLQVIDSRSIQRCTELLDLRWKQDKLVALTLKDKKPRGDATRFYAGNVEFVRVTHVQESTTPVQMYDLEIEGTHNFIGNGIVAHNTTSLVAKVILLLLIPNNLGYLGRLDGKALRASTMQSLYDMLPKEYLSQHNDQKGFLKLKTEYGGGKLIYGDFKDLNDLKNIPLGFFAIDQAEEVPEDVWKYLVGRLRRKNPILHNGTRQYWVHGQCPKSEHIRHFALHGDTQCRLCLSSLPPFDDRIPVGQHDPTWDVLCYNTYGFGACNPEGPSHWIFQYFKGLPGKHGPSGPGKPGYKAFHATAWDGLNAGFVTRRYLEDMEALYKDLPLMWERYLEGKWVEAEGLVYPKWKREQSVVPRHASKHDGTPLFDSNDDCYEWIDHGLSAVTAVGWVIIKECDCGCGKLNYYLVDEHYEGEQVVSHHCQQIKATRERLPYQVKGTYLDSQAFSRTLIGQKGTPREDQLYSVADEYMDHGVYPVANQKDWDAGYNRINELLTLDTTHTHPITGQQGAPHLFVLDKCSHFIKEIEGYKWKKARNTIANNYREEPMDGHDHHLDALNGFLTSRPMDVKWVQDTHNPDDGWDIELDMNIHGAHSSHMSY